MLRRIVPCVPGLVLVACTSASAPPDAATGLDATLTDAAINPDSPLPDVTQDAPPDAATIACPAAVDTVPVPRRHTPRWAFEPWISKDISDTDDTYAFVEGFRSRNIPVGVVVLDSPWETHYNTYLPNPVRYHDFGRLVTDMHDRGVKVVLWTTQFLNRSSYDLETGGDSYPGEAAGYELGRACHFYVNNAATYPWWKGTGAAIDFENPAAVAWWHRAQDTVLDLGIDGWKLDFGDSYVRTDTVQTAAGPISHQTYSEHYYHDYLAYGRMKRGDDFLTMVRAWDASYDFSGRFFARPEDAPVAWMGDNRRDYVGLADALQEMFISAQAGYGVLGSDLGGYLDRDDLNLTGPVIPFDTMLFARWTALSAFTPLMQLHGRANITPWTVPDHVDETVALYRTWATLHHELAPYFYSLAAAHDAGGTAVVRPVGAPDTWAGDYRFTVGDALFVAPIVDASDARDVREPVGERWCDPATWACETQPVAAETARHVTVDRASFPYWWRAGAIVPMNVSTDVTGFGTAASAGALTLAVVPDAATHRFTMIDQDEAPTVVTSAIESGTIAITLARQLRPTIVRVQRATAPATVTASGAALVNRADRAALDAMPSGWFYDAANHSVWVRLAAAASPAQEARIEIR